MYVSAWPDTQTCHPPHQELWDRDNGRIYRIAYGQPKSRAQDLTKLDPVALAKALETAVMKQEDFLQRNAMRAAPMRPDQLAQLQRTEAAQWEPWVKASGFKAED